MTEEYNLYPLHVFLIVARLGSVTRAAQELCISQPAVSWHLKSLEGGKATACVVLDEGRLSSGRAIVLPGLAPAFVAGAVLFASSRLVFENPYHPFRNRNTTSFPQINEPKIASDPPVRIKQFSTVP